MAMRAPFETVRKKYDSHPIYSTTVVCYLPSVASFTAFDKATDSSVGNP